MLRDLLPELVDRALGADDHARVARQRPTCEDAATDARRPDIRAEVTERFEGAVLGHGEKASQPAPDKILEEDALDRILGAEGQNLIGRRRTQLRHLPILPE